MTTTYWSPNQASIAQVETYTFTAPNGVGNTYTATCNGKSITYASVSGDTSTTVATALFTLLNLTTSIMPELTEVTFANPSNAVMTATANTAGTPFANVPGTTAGLVLSTGNGMVNGIATVHTTPNASPSDVNDPQNWLRVNTTATPPTRTRALPQSGDDVVINATSTPLLYSLDQLSSIQFNTYTRWQSMSGQIGLPDFNDNGYVEWRATRFKFNGPQGSTPAGGLALVVGYSDGTGSGPSLERYDLQSSQYTLTGLAGGTVDILGYHTLNTFNAVGSITLLVAAQPGTKSNLSSSTVGSSATVVLGAGVVWSGGSTLTLFGGSTTLNSAPATLDARNGAQVVIATDGLTWATVTGINGCSFTMLAGGIITTFTITTGCTLDKSQDGRALTITNSTMDGDTCQIIDPLNAITFTNATTVKQSVSSGPFQFTGSRTVKVV